MATKNIQLSAATLMLVGLFSSQMALADSAMKVGARAGLVDVDSLGSTIGFGGYAEIGLSKEFSIRPSVDYWQVTKGSGVGFASVEVKVSDLAFGGAAKYTADIPGWAARPYALGGLAMHRVSLEATASSSYASSEYSYEASETKLGFDIGAGVSFPLASGMELSGEILMRNVDEADLLSLTAGFAYKL